MAGLTINVAGIPSLQGMQLFLSPETFNKAQREGIKYAAKAVPPAVAKGVGAAYNIAAARIKKDIRRTTITDNGRTALIGFSRQSPTLMQFKPTMGTRGKQKGLGRGMGWTAPVKPGKSLRAVIIKAKGRQEFSGAFVITGNAGNRLVVRKDANGKMHTVYGPSIGSIVLGTSAAGEGIRADVMGRINDQYAKGFDRSLSATARGYGGR